jgi:hypothetical protein
LIGGGVALANLGGVGRQSASGDVNLSKGLVGQWKFDNNLKDSTPGAHDGTVGGTYTSGADRHANAGKARSQNGTTDFGSVSNFDYNVMRAGQEGASWTMSVWAKAGGANNDETILVGRNGCHGGIYSWSGGYAFAIKTDACWTGSQSINYTPAVMTNWHLLTATYAARAMTFYVDGQSVGTATFSANMQAYGTTLQLGGTGSSGWFYSGSLDDARVYNRALSAAEAKALYDTYDPAVKADSGANGLVGWWKMDGNAKDSSPYGNDGWPSSVSATTDRKGTSSRAYAFTGATPSNIWLPGTGPYATFGTNSFTLVSWIKTTESAGQRCIMSAASGAQGWRFGYDAGKPYYLVGDGVNYQEGTIGTATVNDGNWHQLAITYIYNGTNWAVTSYIDSANTGTVNLPSSIGSVSNAQVNIGTMGGGTNGAVTGSIYDVRVYKRGLSQVEIAAQYNSYNSQLSIGGSGAPGSVSLGKGLVGDWAMNGNAKDNTPYGNNGTVNGAALTTDRKGRANSAYSFNGSTNYIGMPTISIPSDISVSAWVYSTNYSQFGFVVSKYPVNSQWELFFESGVLRWRSSVVDNLASCTDPTNSTWHHLVATQTGTTVQIFIDGSRCFNGAVGGAIGNGSGAVEVGRFNGGYYFGGSIDDVRAWNRVLSQAEVTALYGVYR